MHLRIKVHHLLVVVVLLTLHSVLIHHEVGLHNHVLQSLASNIGQVWHAIFIISNYLTKMCFYESLNRRHSNLTYKVDNPLGRGLVGRPASSDHHLSFLGSSSGSAFRGQPLQTSTLVCLRLLTHSDYCDYLCV